jgi:hypothetical protein
MISSIEILGFLMEVQEGRKGQGEAHFHLFVHQESLEKVKRMGMEALGEESLGASFHGGLMKA